MFGDMQGLPHAAKNYVIILLNFPKFVCHNPEEKLTSEVGFYIYEASIVVIV